MAILNPWPYSANLLYKSSKMDPSLFDIQKVLPLGDTPLDHARDGTASTEPKEQTGSRVKIHDTF